MAVKAQAFPEDLSATKEQHAFQQYITGTAFTPEHDQEDDKKDRGAERFKDIFLNTVHAFVANDSQEDVTVDDLRKEIEVKQNFFDYIVSKFRRKR